jgi:hypothetical protein
VTKLAIDNWQSSDPPAIAGGTDLRLCSLNLATLTTVFALFSNEARCNGLSAAV